MHLPTALRSCAARRVRVREGLLKGSSGSGAAGGALEILCLDVTDEGSGRQWSAGGALQQFLHRHFSAETVDVRAQPAEQSRELPTGKLLVEPGKLGPQALVKLRGDDRTESVRREVAKRAHRPVNVLQTTLEVVAWADAEPLLH